MTWWLRWVVDHWWPVPAGRTETGSYGAGTQVVTVAIPAGPGTVAWSS